MAFDTAADLDEAFSVGAFAVPVPEDWDVRPGLELCRNYYKARQHEDDRYRGHRKKQHEASELGYADGPDQVERLQIESVHWDKYFPDEVTALLRKMQKLALEILVSSFKLSGVRDEHLPVITGGLCEDTGWRCHSTFNHFRSEFKVREGIAQHNDSGFITLFYADRRGLEVHHKGMWRRVPYSSRHFTANFGYEAGILTGNLPRPMTAVLHRVPPTTARDAGEGDRSSFTLFMGSMSIYRYTPEGVLEQVEGLP